MIVRIWRLIVPCGSDWLMLIIRGKTGELESFFGAKIESLTSLRLQIKFVWNCAVDISLFGYLFQQNFLCTMADNSKQEKKIKKPSSYVLKRSKIFFSLCELRWYWPPSCSCTCYFNWSFSFRWKRGGNQSEQSHCQD